jgi:hypothetical protein
MGFISSQMKVIAKSAALKRGGGEAERGKMIFPRKRNSSRFQIENCSTNHPTGNVFSLGLLRDPELAEFRIVEYCFLK